MSKTPMQLREETRRAACIEEVQRQIVFVENSQHVIGVPKNQIKIGEDEEYIEAGMWALTPIPHETGTTDVRISWDVMGFEEVPGHFNPKDGGCGPETKEIGVGEFESIEDALLAIVRYNAQQDLHIVRENMMVEANLNEYYHGA